MKLLNLKKNLPSIIKSKLLYILNDRLGLLVFLLVILESLLFTNILLSDGAAKISFNAFTFDKVKLNILFALIPLSLTYLFSERIRFWLLVIIKLLYSILLVGDFWYFRGFQNFLSLHNLGETGNLHNLGGTAFAMTRSIDIIFVVENVLFLVLALLWRKKYKSGKRQLSVFAIMFLIPFLMLFSMHVQLDYKGSELDGQALFKTQYIPSSTMNILTPIGYHFYDTLMFVKDNLPIKLTTAQKDDIKQWLAYKNEDLPDNEYTAKFKGKNVIFIQVESLENFVINQSVNGQAITPNLNKLLKNSLYFSNLYEQVNNGNSGDADLMVNASVLPVRRGSTFFRFPQNQYNTLPDLLKEEDNYYSRSLHSADGNIWNLNKGLANFSFNSAWDMKDFSNSPIFNMGVTDESFLNTVSTLPQKDKAPFYYYAVTVSSHIPFVMPTNMKGLKLDAALDKTAMGAYFQAVNYTDKQIGNFIKTLDAKGVLDNTEIVIMGDHCGVHKYYEDEVDSLPQKQAWWDNDSRVAFMIYDKNMAGKEIKTIGAQIDVMPTIASLMGIDESKYKNTTIGRNLLNTNKGYALLNNGTIVGADKLSAEDITHIKKSFSISDFITQTDYFKSNK